MSVDYTPRFHTLLIELEGVEHIILGVVHSFSQIRGCQTPGFLSFYVNTRKE